jgi:hypothetical protein
MGFSTPTAPAPDPDERELLLGYVRWQREQVVATTSGLSEDELRWTPDGRLLPIIGVVNHPLRWVLLHLIEETAHHAGHADATRELLDGKRMRT